MVKYKLGSDDTCRVVRSLDYTREGREGSKRGFRSGYRVSNQEVLYFTPGDLREG